MSTPCPGPFKYTEATVNTSTRILVSTCLTCGSEVASNLLKSQDELRFWCDSVITPEDAKACMRDLEDCHRAGLSYSHYVGLHHNGDEMTDEEFAAVTEALSRLEVLDA